MLARGFADPVHDAQAAFRALLEATARPGTVVSLPQPTAPPPLPPAAAAIALALCDGDTPVWLDDRLASAPVRAWLRFHAASPLVADIGAATFAFASGDEAPFDALATGTDEAPERSATLVLLVDAFGAGCALRLGGPGIAEETVLRVAGLPNGFVGWRARNFALYPRGVDVILVSGTEAAALPRSTAVREG